MPPRAATLPVHALYAVSGAVSLGYQVCWFRIFVEAFGSTSLTFALVVASFIGGLGTGALLSRRIVAAVAERTGLEAPLRIYGAIELLIAGAAAWTLLAQLVPADALGTFPYTLEEGIWTPALGHRVGVAMAVAGLVFIPCVGMGATFPWLCRAHHRRLRFPSALYAANTLGACAGILACEFLLFPSVGHRVAFGLCVAANAGIGLAFLSGCVGPRAVARPEAPEPVSAGAGGAAPAPQAAAGVPAEAALAVPGLLGCAVLGGLLTGALEADVLRRLRFTQFRSEAAMSFVSLWAVLGIFLGSATVQLRPRLRLRGLQMAAVGALAAWAASWWLAAPLEEAVTRAFGAGAVAAPPDAPQALAQLYRSSAGLLPTAVFTGLTVLPAFYGLSWLLPFACDRLHAGGRTLGLAYGLNTLAFCAGTLAFGWLAPRVDVFYATKLFGGVFAVGVVWLLLLRAARGAAATGALGAAAGVAVAVLATAVPRGFDPDYFRPQDPAVRGEVSHLRADGQATTFVVEADGVRHLYFDAFSMSATTPGAQRYMRLMAHFPLLAHPDPERALVICFGVGNTTSAVAAHRRVERIDVVDLSRPVFETAPAFAHASRLVHLDPRLRRIHDDGRHYLEVTDERYDLITSEPPPPRHEGVYRLYSVEYYRAARARLREAGLMTQWLSVRQMPAEAVELAIRSFLEVFPHALLFVGAQYDFILLGSPAPIDLATLERRFRESPQARADLRRIGVPSAASLLARIVRSDRQLRADVGPGRVLSDVRNDWSYVFFGGSGPPQIRYAPVALWRELGLEELESAGALRRMTRNLGLLRSHVPDFPLRTLASVREAPGADRVRFAEADWEKVHQLNRRARRRRRGGDLAAAAAHYRASLEHVDDQLPVWISLARVERARGDLAASAKALGGYVERRPEDAWGHFQRGRALLQLGRSQKAVEAFRAARRRSPGSREIARALERAGRAVEASSGDDAALPPPASAPAPGAGDEGPEPGR